MRRRIFFCILSLTILVSALILGVGFKLYHKVDNTDRSIRLEFITPLKLLLTTENPEYFNNLMDYDSIKQTSFDPNDANFCTPNISNDTDTQQKLLSFIQGPCSPVVIVPGLTASKLQLTIDCPTLQREAPNIFASCGWSTCSWSIIHSKPAPEYILWVASVDSPMGFIIPGWETSECFGNLVKLDYNETEKEIYLKYSNPPGVNITWFGNTPETVALKECGFASINDLLPFPFQTSETAGYHQIQEYYKYMGYQVGLNLFAVPYDFRKTTLANELIYTLKRTIKYAHALTGKKVILMAHSMGNFGALNILNSMTPEEKEEMILNYIAVTPPFLGATKALKIVIGGDDEFIWHHLGLSFFSQKMFLGSSSAAYDLLPKDAFFRFQNETWLKDVLKRLNLQKSYNINTDEGKNFWKQAELDENYTYTWFPTPLQQCFSGFTDRSNSCLLTVDDWSSTPLLSIETDSFTKDYYANYPNITNMLESFAKFSNYTLELLNDAYENKIHELINPEVPILLIYGSHSPTEYVAQYYYDPNPVTSSGSFAFPSNETTTAGDTAVPSTSAILPGLKWAWEFDNKNSIKELAHAKPVKMIEWCSHYNAKEWIYDTNYTNETNEFLNNEYIGLNCSCQPKPGLQTSGDYCVHSSIMNDQYFINLMVNIAKSYQNVNNISNTFAHNTTAFDLESLVDACPTLTSNKLTQDIGDLIKSSFYE